MEAKHEKVFFSPNENILFWLPGHRQHDCAANARQYIAQLEKDLAAFAQFGTFDPLKAGLDHIERSPRYGFMRILWVEDPESVHPDVFNIGPDWDMRTWIYR